MEEEIKEVLAENEAKRKPEQAEQTINPLDYVTIPIKEYRKLIKKVERVKAQNKQLKELADLQKDAENYRRWWREEEAKSADLAKQLEESKEVIKQYKADYEKKLGIEVQDA